MKKIKGLTTPGRAWAYLFLAIGLGISFWANISAVHIAPLNWVGSYSPPLVRIMMAGLAPLAMFGAIEVVARNLWPGDWYWKLAKWGLAISVGVWAGVISYRHLYHLACNNMGLDPGEFNVEAAGTPIMIDVLILLCTAALLIPQPQVEVKTSTPATRRAARAAALADASSVGLGVAFGTVPEIRVVEKVITVEKERPVVKRTPVAPPTGDRKRYAAGEHPKYPDWEAARMSNTPWTVEDMRVALGGTATAARSMLQRWERHYQDAHAGV